MILNNSYFLQGRIEKVMISASKETIVTKEVTKANFSIDGIEGDNHYGFERASGVREARIYDRGTKIRNNRQWSAVAVEELQQIATALGVEEIKAEWLGANLLVSGIPSFSKIPSMSHILIGMEGEAATLIVYEENLPCTGPGNVIAAKHNRDELAGLFPQKALHRRGLVGWIERENEISAGMSCKIFFPTYIDESYINTHFRPNMER